MASWDLLLSAYAAGIWISNGVHSFQAKNQDQNRLKEFLLKLSFLIRPEEIENLRNLALRGVDPKVPLQGKILEWAELKSE